MLSIGIIGGTGYTGKELVKYCSAHPFVKDYHIYGDKSAGEQLYTIFPDLQSIVEDLQVGSIKNISLEHDLYFIALPHGEALNYVPNLIANNKYVIDLGGDYRLNVEELYNQWYKFTHTSSYLLNSKIYGLADFWGTNYENHKLIANPGCYPTAVLLSLLPLVVNFSDKILSVSCIAYSGTSGAGKKAKAELLLSEMDGNVKAYNVNEHKHEPEILQQLNKYEFNSPLSFTTHLLPIAKGIYVTTSVHLNDSLKFEEILDAYNEGYSKSPFVRMRKTPPELQWVVNTNFCDISLSLKNKVLIITSAIDNLIKGASGQAIQNMNKLFGWDETLGFYASKSGEINKELKNVSVY
jgi:N-acetyl-gamma-glutamyl-phosphate reductase